MLSSLLIESTRTFDLREKASEQEVFDRVRQLQKENTQQKCVPEFYFGPTKVEAGSVAFHMRRVVQRKQTEQLLLGITKLIEELQDNSSEQDRVSHSEFQKVLKENNLELSPFNFSGIFLRQHGADRSVCKRTLVDELHSRRWPLKLSIRLMEYDTDADGHLTLGEVQQWLSDFADECQWPIPASLRPTWLAIAPRKVFFLLGHNNLVSIDKLVQHEMMQPLEHYVASEYADNLDWFGPQKVGQIWQKFSDLDRDGDGLLSIEELGPIRPINTQAHQSTMAPYFLERVWEVHVTTISPAHKQPAMSLEDFSDFLLAWQHRGQPAACRYFFKAFDIEHKQKLSGTVISKWLQTVLEHCESTDSPLDKDEHNPENFRNEVFDFVKPKSAQFITLEDLCHCEPTGDHPSTLDVCGVLCDAQCMLQHCSQ